MNKVLLLSAIMAISLFLSTNLQAQTSVGVGLAYGADLEEIGLQVNGTYKLDDKMRVSADFIYYLIGDEEFFGMTIKSTAFELNGNFHYTFYNTNDIEVYGIGSLGIHYAGVEVSAGGSTNSDSDTKIGLGVGAGAEYDLGRVKLFLEPRFFLSGYDQLNLGFGVRIGL